MPSAVRCAGAKWRQKYRKTFENSDKIEKPLLLPIYELFDTPNRSMIPDVNKIINKCNYLL